MSLFVNRCSWSHFQQSVYLLNLVYLTIYCSLKTLCSTQNESSPVTVSDEESSPVTVSDEEGIYNNWILKQSLVFY